MYSSNILIGKLVTSYVHVSCFRSGARQTKLNKKVKKLKSKTTSEKDVFSHEKAPPFTTRLKHMLAPTALTIGCCYGIESLSKPLCDYLFPAKNIHLKLDEFFNSNRSSRAGPMAEWWASKSNVSKLAWSFAFVNGAVFVSFRMFPRLMLNLFVAGPSFSTLAIPLAMFSHIGGLHFLINNYVLIHSSSICSLSLAPENFIELYLEAGIVTNYLVVASKILSGSYKYAVVGASAAIYGIFGYISQAEPNVNVGILLLSDIFPSLRFQMQHLPGVVLCVEGALFISKFFVSAMKNKNPIAHEAHIIGMLLGMLYYKALKSQREDNEE